jgi:hypothetical protein
MKKFNLVFCTLISLLSVAPAFALTTVPDDDVPVPANAPVPVIAAPVSAKSNQCYLLDPMQGDLRIDLKSPISQIVSIEGSIQEHSTTGDNLRTLDYNGALTEDTADGNNKEFLAYPIYSVIADTPTKHFYQVKPGDSVVTRDRLLLKLNIRRRALRFNTQTPLLSGTLNVCVK